MLFGSTMGRGRRGFFGGGVPTSGLVEGDGIMPPLPGRIGGYVDRFNAAPAEQESMMISFGSLWSEPGRKLPLPLGSLFR